MSVPCRCFSSERSACVALIAGIGWNGVKNPSGNVAFQTVRLLPDALRYCTEAEIGGCVKRPMEKRHTVSGFCVYVNDPRGEMYWIVYDEG
jgi:hypothetical protein